MRGFSTVVPPTWTPAFEKYADTTIAGSASYTPAVKGIFQSPLSAAEGQTWYIHAELYSNAEARWKKAVTPDLYTHINIAIGDGSNLRFTNSSANAGYIVLMRFG
jgi:hypothetical protein